MRYVMQTASGLVHRTDCMTYTGKPGNGWVEVPEEVLRAFVARMAPNWLPPHERGKLGVCMRCEPHK